MEKLFRNIGTGQPIYDPIPNNNPGAGISPQSPYVNESFVSSNPFSNPRADMNNQIAVQNQATVTNGPQIPYQSPPQTGTMALTPEQLRIQASAEGSGPPLTLEQSEQMRRMHPQIQPYPHERSQPNTTMMGFFNNGQPDNLDQMYNTGQNTVPSSTSGPLNPFGLPDNPNFSFDPARLQQPLSFDGNNPGNPFDSMPNNINPGDLIGGNNPIMNNPIMNNPIAPMPSPLTPPSGMNNNQDYSGLLKGIGEIFEQYFPQQGGSTQFNQPGAQPTFDATGNSVSGGQTQSNQVFGNMITPDFGSY